MKFGNYWLVLETNRFADSVCGTTPRARPWIDVSQQEMRAFFGVLIYMGVCRLPRLGLYWTTKFPLDVHGVADVMSINGFQQLFRCLHLADNSAQIPVGQPGHDRLFKVRGLLDLLIPKFESEYHIHQECTIDEAMIPFKGRLAFKQYMKAKPTKWGIKVFVLADASNGYIRTFQIYTGKSLEDGNSSVGLCTKVVLDLMSGLEGSGLHLYTDNYNTSPSLYLYNRGITACGTGRPNRIGFPKELLTKATNTNRGFVDFLSNGPLLATIWVDKRSIYFLSTIHVAEPPLGSTCAVKRRTTTGAQEDKPCPPCLPDYQCFMREVDLNDQMEQYYNLGRSSIKWWKRIFYYLVESTILNSFIMESHVRTAEHTHVSTRRDYLTFRLVLASELIGTFTSRKRLGRPRSDEHAERTCLNLDLEVMSMPSVPA